MEPSSIHPKAFEVSISMRSRCMEQQLQRANRCSFDTSRAQSCLPRASPASLCCQNTFLLFFFSFWHALKGWGFWWPCRLARFPLGWNFTRHQGHQTGLMARHVLFWSGMNPSRLRPPPERWLRRSRALMQRSALSEEVATNQENYLGRVV